MFGLESWLDEKHALDWDALKAEVEGRFAAGLEDNSSLGTNTIKSVFERYCGHLKINDKFCDAIAAYAYHFVTKNQDHIHFFGNALIGVYPIKFTTEDWNTWFDDILDCDETDLAEDLYETPFVNRNFHVTGNVFNLSMGWVLHALHVSPLIKSETKREEAKLNVMRIYHYKCMSSIQSHDYRYPANKSVAQQTYNQLSKKFDLKVHGSWGALFDARAKSIVTKGLGVHYNTYVRFTDDKAIIYMIGDIQDRLRDVCNAINRVFHEVKNNTNNITTSSSMVEMDGVSTVGDVSKQVTQYQRYISTVITNQATFIKPELVSLAANAIKNCPPDKLERALKVMSDNYGEKGAERYALFVEECIIHLFDYMKSKRMKMNDLPDVVSKMRGAYTSSRSSNEALIQLRDWGDAIVKEATNVKTPATIIAIRTALMIYIVLRTLTKGYYS